MSLLAVDPGVRGCGVALFNDVGLLVAAAYVNNAVHPPETRLCRAEEAANMAASIFDKFKYAAVSEMVVEWPTVYATMIRKGESPGDPNDLLPLAGIVSATAALFAVKTESVRPASWKGQMSKDVSRYRITTRLSPNELEVLQAACRETKKDLGHNIWDGVGIGLYYLDRLKPHKVIPS